MNRPSVIVTAFAFLGLVLAGCSAPGPDPATTPDAEAFGPHVIIGIPDTGINPYHELFYRPDLTEHPCTYIRDMPCTLRELRLHVGMEDWDAAFELDRAVWDSLERGVWYWIPQTVFVAVSCHPRGDETFPFDFEACLTEEFVHGTATTSIAVMTNPAAYIAFTEASGIVPFLEGGIPVDVYSVSWGSDIPQPIPRAVIPCPFGEGAPLYVTIAGNNANVGLADCEKARPDVISVGGGYTQPYGHEAHSGDFNDIESYYCPPYASSDAVSGLEEPGSFCGTSFAAPIVAGALSKVILALRTMTGYNGTVTEAGEIDPVSGVTTGELRDAMNRTASYTPKPRYPVPNEGDYIVQEPLNPVAPWLQWGWGFYDGDLANATIAHLLGDQEAQEKPAAAVQYMESMYALRQGLYG